MSARDRLDRALLTLAAEDRRPRCGEYADRNLWTSERPGDRARAADLCARCPILRECAEAAEEGQHRFGTWGGRDRTDRRKTKEKKQ